MPAAAAAAVFEQHFKFVITLKIRILHCAYGFVFYHEVCIQHELLQ